MTMESTIYPWILVSLSVDKNQLQLVYSSTLTTITYKIEEPIRFKVVSEEFNDTTPSTGPIGEAVIGEVGKDNKKFAFRLIVISSIFLSH